MPHVVGGLVAACAIAVAGCGPGPGPGADGGHTQDGSPVHGAHTAPPGSTGVAIGDHLAHLAVTVDPTSGTLTVRVYDGSFVSPVRVAQRELVIRVLGPPGESVDVVCAAQADALSGETVGHTSTFRGQADALTTRTAFDAVVQELHVKGQVVRALKFPYPAGIKLH